MLDAHASRLPEVTIVACMHKLLTIPDPMLRDQVIWNAANALETTETI